ncbi:hypothetical protein [Nocardia rhamnosiphila]
MDDPGRLASEGAPFDQSFEAAEVLAWGDAEFDEDIGGATAAPMAPDEGELEDFGCSLYIC